MKSGQLGFCVLLSLVASQVVLCEETNLEYIGQNDYVASNATIAYGLGVHMGIINSEKYTLESFESDERNFFKDLYKEYISLNGSQPIDYKQWLVMNNFGILPDTQESLFGEKINTRSKKNRFVNLVKTGDILITGRGFGGLVGHAAIMATDNTVLEMPGNKNQGVNSNNSKLSKQQWYDRHGSGWIHVYRCPDTATARQAASWAYRNYYNPSGGSQKTIHITYRISTEIWKKNPSYCSKLVIHAYYFGTGKKQVIKNLSLIGRAIPPTGIPSYFMSPYKLRKVGNF